MLSLVLWWGQEMEGWVDPGLESLLIGDWSSEWEVEV